jgi:quercetin dioxygenase-like cupin family protein
MLKKMIVAVALLCTVSAWALGKKEANDKTAAVTQEASSINVGNVQFVQPFGPQGPAIGLVRGKLGAMDGKPTTFFVKFTAGGDSGWHTHSQDYTAVVLKGTFTEQQQGEATETPLPPGTYVMQASKIPHRNGCLKGGDDCLVFVHFDKGADSTMTTPDGKPLPMPAAKN